MPSDNADPSPIPPVIASGDRSVAARTIQNSVVVTGDHNVVAYTAVPTPTALRQIPAPTADFVGRDAEITALVTELSAPPGSGAALGCAHGLGGTGKTQ